MGVLRDVADADLEVFYEHQLDPEAARMAAFPPRDRDAFMARWAKSLANATNVRRTVLADGEVAGNIGCWHATAGGSSATGSVASSGAEGSRRRRWRSSSRSSTRDPCTRTS